MVIRQVLPESHQLDLLGGGIASTEVHRLFFALIPDQATRLALTALAESTRASRPHFRARWIQPARYHATLRFLGDHSALRPVLVDAAMGAAARLTAMPFDWSLDTIGTFRGREPPCVLRSEESSEPMLQLWQSLGQMLALAGVPLPRESAFTPHVTLAYSAGVMLDSMAVGPLPWRVDAFALIHSVVGRSNHEILGSWPLSGS
jgi:2'-5' RNA ligase